MNEDTNAETIAAYESTVAQYNAAAIPEVSGSIKDWVDATLALLKPDARILEIGSAHGRDALYIESQGFTVERTDATPAFVEYLKSQGHPARLLDALTGDYGTGYDLVYANAVLLHFTVAQTKVALERIHQALKPDGLLSFSVKIGDGADWAKSKIDGRRYFTYWQEADLRTLLADMHFGPIYFETGETGHNSGTWYHVIVRRIA